MRTSAAVVILLAALPACGNRESRTAPPVREDSAPPVHEASATPEAAVPALRDQAPGNRALATTLQLPAVAELADDRSAIIDALRDFVDDLHQDKSTASVLVYRGRRFNGFPAITALLYGSRPHCTATVIAARTALTAAHCVRGYDPTLMKLAVGPSAYTPAERYRLDGQPVVHEDYHPIVQGQPEPVPDDMNDVALLYLDRPFAHPSIDLPAGDSTSQMTGRRLVVGYGYESMDDDDPSGLGEKRYALMELGQATTRTVRGRDTHFGTCPGDSGGPTLSGSTQQAGQIIAITSAGQKRCGTTQISMRVDAYLDWIRARLR